MRDLPLACPSPDILTIVNENEHQRIDEKHGSGKNITNGGNTIGQDPIKYFERHSERKGSFAGNENSKQFSGVAVIAIDLPLDVFQSKA